MDTADTTTEAFANTRASSAVDLPDYAPIPPSAFGPALNEQGYSSAEWNETFTGSPTAPTNQRS
jgi:hypothetical protein